VSRTTFAAGQPAAWHIFATGSRLGWAAGLGEYSVGPADQSIIEHLQTAGEHVMWANRESRPPTLAWPGWSATRATLRGWADELATTQRNDVRRRIARDAASAISGLAPQLGYQTAGDTAPRATCDAAYVRLGFELGYGQQAMLVADEAVRNADRRASVAPRQDALSHLRTVVSLLINYDQIRVASGRCADLRDVRTLVERVLATNANDVAAQAATATAAWELANERIAILRNDGPTVAAPTPIPQATAPSRPPPAAPPAVPAPGGTPPIRVRTDGYYVARNLSGGLLAIRFLSDRSLRIAGSEPVWSGQMTGNPPMPVPAPPAAQYQRVVWLLQQLPARWQDAESTDLTFERQGDTIPLRKADPLQLTRQPRILTSYVRCNDFAELELASVVEFFLQPRCRPGFRKIPFEFVPHAW
jgi:hypothetical protein